MSRPDKVTLIWQKTHSVGNSNPRSFPQLPQAVSRTGEISALHKRQRVFSIKLWRMPIGAILDGTFFTPLSIQKTPRNCTTNISNVVISLRSSRDTASQHHDTRQSQAKSTERSFYFLRERNEHKQARLVGSWSRNFFLVSRRRGGTRTPARRQLHHTQPDVQYLSSMQTSRNNHILLLFSLCCF